MKVIVQPSKTAVTVEFVPKVTDDTITFTALQTGGTPLDPPPVVVEPPPVVTGRKNLIKETLFNGKEPTPFGGWGLETCTSTALTVVPEGLRVLLNINDKQACINKKISSIRAEIKLATEATANVERWVGESFLFPLGYKADPKCPEILLQWHHNSGQGSPPLAIWSLGDALWVNRRNNVTDDDVLVKLCPITPGQRMDLVGHIKFSGTANGLTQFWVNGVKLYDQAGPNNYADATVGKTYLKTGIYKWGWVNGYPSTVAERMFYISNFRYGNELATFMDVTP